MTACQVPFLHNGMESNSVLISHVVQISQIMWFISSFSKLSRVHSWFLRANRLCKRSTRQDSSSGTGEYFMLLFTTAADKLSMLVSHSLAILDRFFLKTVLLSITLKLDNTLTDSFLQLLIICENLTNLADNIIFGCGQSVSCETKYLCVVLGTLKQILIATLKLL